MEGDDNQHKDDKTSSDGGNYKIPDPVIHDSSLSVGEIQEGGAASEETSTLSADINENRKSPKQGDITINDTPNDESAAILPEKMSKKKRKRLLKLEKFQAKKLKLKEERHAKAIAAGRDLDAERKRQEERTASGERKKRLEHFWQNEKLPPAQKCFRICIDCSFESLMQEREIASLAQQIRYCYSYNKRSPNSCLVAATSIQNDDTTLTLLKKEAGFSEWANRLFTCTDQSLEEYYKDDLSKIVYLTSDSDNVIEELENDRIYVIGGIVDRNRLKRTAFDRAKKLGVATAKLPLDSHLAKMASTPVLTCNHVFDILLKYRQHGNDWAKALQDVLPSRKDAKFNS